MSQNSDKLETKNEKETVNWKSELISWIQIIIAAAVIALFLNSCIIANSQIPSESMENTIMAHDRVIGSRLSYLFSEPERGDVIIFHYPDDPTGDTYYVKRVIGLPGDVIDIHERRRLLKRIGYSVRRALYQGTYGNGFQSSAPLRSAGRQLFYDGRQPQRFLGCPLLGEHLGNERQADCQSAVPLLSV